MGQRPEAEIPRRQGRRGRALRRLDPTAGPVQEFAAQLRALRCEAGEPPFAVMATRVHWGTSALAAATRGERLPTWEVTEGFVCALGGDVNLWRRRWEAADRATRGLPTTDLDTGTTDLDTGRNDSRFSETPSDVILTGVIPTTGTPPGGARPCGATDSHGPESVPRPDLCPYPGLAAFGPDTERFFFGRRRLTTELVALVASGQGNAAGEGNVPAPVMVVGPSGSGKSSLLRAGLLPMLARGEAAVPGMHACDPLLITPTVDPLGELARGLLTVRAPLVLVVDQFEEVFTLCPDESTRLAFVQALRELADDATVVLGLRADFYGHCADHPWLLAGLTTAQLLVGPMSAGDLREAIESPARAVGLTVQPGLTELMLRDLGLPNPAGSGNRAGQLPLLGHALLATWQQREGRSLTVAGYQASGGISGAVALTAERIFTGLGDDAQRIARGLLLRLVQIGEDGRDARRRADRVRLMGEAGDPVVATATCESLAAARLVTLDEATIEIVHDALLTAWPRLRGWIDEDRAGHLTRQRLAEAAAAWLREDRDPAGLYRGGRLAAAREWAAARASVDLDRTTAEFLMASLAAERSADRARALRNRRLRRLVAALSVLAVAAVAAGLVAVRQRASAEQRTTLIASRQAAGQADLVRSGDPALALRLSLAAYRLAPTAEAQGALLSTVTYGSPVTLPAGFDGPVGSVAYSADGSTLAASGRDSPDVRLWDVADAAHPRLTARLRVGARSPVLFGPRGGLLAAAGPGRTVYLWDVARPNGPRPLGPLLSDVDVIDAMAFSPDGRTLALAARGERRVRLFDVSDPARPVARGVLLMGDADPSAPVSPVASGMGSAVAFSPDGRTLATAVPGTAVQVWDVVDQSQPRFVANLPGGDGVDALAFSPTEPLLAVARNGRCERWDMTDPAHPLQQAAGSVLSDEPDGNAVTSLSFVADGRILVTSSADGTVSFITARDGRRFNKFHEPARVGAVAIGRPAVAMGTDRGGVHLWRALTPILLADRPSISPRPVFSADGHLMATIDGEGSLRLWDVSAPDRPRAASTLPGPVRMASFAPGRRILLVEGPDGHAELWSVADTDRAVRLAVIPSASANPAEPAGTVEPAGTAGTVAFAGGNTVVRYAPDGRLQLWDITDPGHPELAAGVPAGFTGERAMVSFSPNGRVLAVGSHNGPLTVRLWEISDPRRPVALATLTDQTASAPRASSNTVPGNPADSTGSTPFPDTPATVAFSADGRVLAVPDAAHRVHLWDITDPHRPVVGRVLPHTARLGSLVFSRHGSMLALGGFDSAVHLWNVGDVQRPTKIVSLPAGSTTNHLDFSADGRLLVGGGPSGIIVWNLTKPDRPALAARFAFGGGSASPDSPAARTVTFVPDSQFLAISVDSPVTLIVDLNAERLYRSLCSLPGSRISQSEWKHYLPDTPYRRPC